MSIDVYQWTLVSGTLFHCNAWKCEKWCTHYCGVFVCRGSLQLLCGGGDMVEAILMQCPPLPDSAPILLFPFHCDSCWDRLLGNHIPGTKRAQLVWTGLSDTTSCSGCESLLSMQAFGLKISCHDSLLYTYSSLVWMGSMMDCTVICICMVLKDFFLTKRWFVLCFLAFLNGYIQDFPLFLSPVSTVKTACPCLFVSVVNKITPIFPSNSGAFHFNQEGWGQWIQESFSILGAN